MLLLKASNTCFSILAMVHKGEAIENECCNTQLHVTT